MFELLVKNHPTWLACHVIFLFWKKAGRFILAKTNLAISHGMWRPLRLPRKSNVLYQALPVASAHGTVAHHTAISLLEESVALAEAEKKCRPLRGAEALVCFLTWGISLVFDLSLPTFFLHVVLLDVWKRLSKRSSPWPWKTFASQDAEF